jgi:hypothetical protein
MVVAENRLVGPATVTGSKPNLLIDELLQLRIMNNDKVDHPRKGSKDLSDAVCGAIYNSIAHTPRNLDDSIEVKTLDYVRREIVANTIEQSKNDGVIRAPKRGMQKDLEEFLTRISTI